MVALPLLAGTAAFLGLIQVYCVALGLAGTGMTQPLAVAGGAGALVLATGFATRFRGRGEHAPPADGDPAGRTVNGVVRVVAVVALTWTVVIWGQLWWLAWLREPVGWDALWYHIPAINEWVVHGGVGFRALDPALSNMPLEVLTAGWLNLPMGVELTAFWLRFVTGSDRLVDGANLLYWPLAIAALVVLAEGLGARGSWRWLAGGLLAGVSLFVAQSATAYVDPGFAAAAMAAIAAAFVFVFDRDGRPWWNAALLGLALGLMLGTKGFGAPFTVVVAGTSALGAALVRRRPSGRRQLARLALAGVVAVGVGGYWYLRNAVRTGNPIYPIQLQLGHKVLAPGYDLANYDELEWVVRPALRPYPPWTRMYVAWLQPDLASLHPDQEPHYAPAGGLGFVWLLGGVPASLCLAIGAFRRRKSEMARRFLFLAGTVLLALSVTTIKWQARYTFWLHALGLPAVAFGLSHAASRATRGGRLVAVAAAAGLAGIAVWESRLAVRLEWRTGRAPDAGTGMPAFHQAGDTLWPGMRTARGFAELFAARRIARGPWQTETGTLAGGALALPLGREIVVLPREPDSAQLTRLVDAGIVWVFWEAPDSASLPAALRSSMTETYRYDRSGAYDFHAVRLAGGGTRGGTIP
jgi:hypothetical protein